MPVSEMKSREAPSEARPAGEEKRAAVRGGPVEEPGVRGVPAKVDAAYQVVGPEW